MFYNYIARCFFLVDLKVGKVTPQDIGQMQLYKHYYEREMMRPGDNPPVGIVLGSSADSAVVKYTLNEHERNLFAVKYHLSLPTVEELQRELQRERAAIEEAKADMVCWDASVTLLCRSASFSTAVQADSVDRDKGFYGKDGSEEEN